MPALFSSEEPVLRCFSGSARDNDTGKFEIHIVETTQAIGKELQTVFVVHSWAQPEEISGPSSRIPWAGVGDLGNVYHGDTKRPLRERLASMREVIHVAQCLDEATYREAFSGDLREGIAFLEENIIAPANRVTTSHNYRALDMAAEVALALETDIDTHTALRIGNITLRNRILASIPPERLIEELGGHLDDIDVDPSGHPIKLYWIEELGMQFIHVEDATPGKPDAFIRTVDDERYGSARQALAAAAGMSVDRYYGKVIMET